MEAPSIDEAEVEPKLYLIGATTGAGTPAGGLFSEQLAGVLEQARPAAVLLRWSWLESEPRETVARVLQIARECGVAVFVEDRADLAVDLGADGVHLSDIDHVQAARGQLQRDQVLGAAAGLSRHDAMQAGEQGADYVAFGQLGQSADQAVLDLVAWWQELFVLPCLAFASDAEEAAALAKAGTDFIGVSDAVWNHPENPAAGARLLQAAIGTK